MELLQDSDDHRLRLDIWSVRELVSHRTAPESERVEICTFFCLELCLILLEFGSEITEEILTIAVIDEFFCMREIELVCSKILYDKRLRLTISIIVEYSWGYSRCCKYSLPEIELMSLIEEGSYLSDI